MFRKELRDQKLRTNHHLLDQQLFVHGIAYLLFRIPYWNKIIRSRIVSYFKLYETTRLGRDSEKISLHYVHLRVTMAFMTHWSTSNRQQVRGLQSTIVLIEYLQILSTGSSDTFLRTHSQTSVLFRQNREIHEIQRAHDTSIAKRPRPNGQWNSLNQECRALVEKGKIVNGTQNIHEALLNWTQFYLFILFSHLFRSF